MGVFWADDPDEAARDPAVAHQPRRGRIRTVRLAIAKQRPWAAAMAAVLIPMTSPSVVTSGPPELPGLSAGVGLDDIVDDAGRIAIEAIVPAR